jgi:hypothetical protein
MEVPKAKLLPVEKWGQDVRLGKCCSPGTVLSTLHLLYTVTVLSQERNGMVNKLLGLFRS